MAVQVPIPVRFEDVFPAGAFATVVEAVRDFDAARSSASGELVQARDKLTGLLLWAVTVFDADPNAREATVKVKVPASHQPVPPEATAGTPFRPVEFDELTVTPYVKEGGRPRVAYSLRASGMRPAGKRPASASAAAA